MQNVVYVNRKIKVKSDISLRDFYNKRNKVLILRDAGGLGDILMMRMIFEDFQKIMPEAEISFAIPTDYHRAVFWHPYIKEILNSKSVDENEFGVHYNITTPCIRYEMKIRPKADKHRAEIWSDYCGVELKNANMHLNIPNILKEYGKKKIQNALPDRKNGYICVCPISNMVSKDLDNTQIEEVLNGIRDLGYQPFILHHKPITTSCPVLKAPHDEWLAIINASDYVISVDTAAFHAAGGLDKPTVAIFSWACGLTYGKFHKKHILIQRHRNHNPEWTCGPCYAHPDCPKTKNPRKPCITEITSKEILNAFKTLVERYPLNQDYIPQLS